MVVSDEKMAKRIAAKKVYEQLMENDPVTKSRFLDKAIFNAAKKILEEQRGEMKDAYETAAAMFGHGLGMTMYVIQADKKGEFGNVAKLIPVDNPEAIKQLLEGMVSELEGKK